MSFNRLGMKEMLCVGNNAVLFSKKGINEIMVTLKKLKITVLCEITWTRKKNHVFFHIHNVDFREGQNREVAIKQDIVGDRKTREGMCTSDEIYIYHGDVKRDVKRQLFHFITSQNN